MNSSVLLGFATLAYLLSSASYIALFIFRNKSLGLVGITSAILGLVLHSGGIVSRWQESHQLGYGHVPLTNLYESLIFFAWCISLIYIFLEFKFKNRSLGAFVMPFALAAMAGASIMDDSINPLLPALQSNWLLIHVITCFIGYAAFAAGCGLGLTYILKKSSEDKKSGSTSRLAALPPARDLDELVHNTILFGFLWLSGGIITGAVWANEAWGTYWQWDPKETWSLITWFVYALMLHVRFTRGWSGKRFAWCAVTGFSSVLITYFAVNFLPGLHSYGSFNIDKLLDGLKSLFQ